MPPFPRRRWLRLSDGFWYSREPNAEDLADRAQRVARWQADREKDRSA